MLALIADEDLDDLRVDDSSEGSSKAVCQPKVAHWQERISEESESID